MCTPTPADRGWTTEQGAKLSTYSLRVWSGTSSWLAETRGWSFSLGVIHGKVRGPLGPFPSSLLEFALQKASRQRGTHSQPMQTGFLGKGAWKVCISFDGRSPFYFCIEMLNLEQLRSLVSSGPPRPVARSRPDLVRARADSPPGEGRCHGVVVADRGLSSLYSYVQ